MKLDKPLRILIVRLGAIGDIVHTLPALAALRRGLPDAHIAWAVERGGGAKLLQGNPALNELIELDMRGWRKTLWHPATWRAIRHSAKRLRDGAFDVALDFQGLLKSAGVASRARARMTVGFATEVLREPMAARFYDRQVTADDHGHVIQKNLQLAAALGYDISGDYEFPMGLTEAEDLLGKVTMVNYDGRMALLNPGGGWPTKLWNTAGFAAVADRLWEAYRMRSLVTYGPGEETLAREIVAQARTGAAEIYDATLRELWAVARYAKLFVGGDTGPMHIAAAAGTPIVALFGPTSAQRNGPFDPRDEIVERYDLDCRTDCYRRACSHTSCMKIPVEMVWAAVQKRMQKAERGMRNLLVHP
jgi:lipopolysaccharide heptosyltransferase I